MKDSSEFSEEHRLKDLEKVKVIIEETTTVHAYHRHTAAVTEDMRRRQGIKLASTSTLTSACETEGNQMEAGCTAEEQPAVRGNALTSTCEKDEKGQSQCSIDVFRW